jgi:Domain of unknown function (DUF4331)
MSSHKEAPAIAKDPAADSADLYAFVSPDAPSTVTILANYVPLQDPDGGPNFAEFGAKTVVGNAAPVGDDVLYEINIDNTGTGIPSITYQFQFTTTILDPNTFLYNTGPITYDGGYSSTWNRRQTYTVTRIDTNPATGASTSTVISPPAGSGGVFACPPCNVGIRSTPNYQTLSAPAVYRMSDGLIVFAGQRADGFFVDLGSIFDLADLRPISSHHLIPGANTPGINSLADKNVHTIALQIPICSLTSDGASLTMGANDPHAVIGVYTTANRQTVRMFDPTTGVTTATGPYNQVSRLGSPLVNEVVVPMASKDYFNSQPPVKDAQFAAAVEHPELQGLLPVLYPGAFPNLAAYTKARADLVAIFATGIPGSVIGSAFGVGTYQGGKVIAEMLRLNMGIAPTSSDGTQAGTSNLGLLGSDLAGYPNGRRPTDDVVTIALMAVAGATIPLTDPTYTPDADVSVVNQGVTASPRAYQAGFPYLADPHGGFSNPPSTPAYNTNPEL